MVVDASNHVSLSKTKGNRIIETIYEGKYPLVNPIENTSTPFYSRTITELGFDGVRITDQDSNTILTRNDLLGRKLSYTDPGMGT